jgi:hypothetical protein
MTTPPDKAVSIEFVLDPEASSIPDEISQYTGLFQFYFPACQVYNDLSKDIRIISMPGSTRVIDLLRRTDMMKIVGIWRDDVNGDYDGLTSFERLMNIRFLCKYLPVLGTFTWINKAGTIQETVISYALNADIEPGCRDLISYNFEFLVLDREIE